ncbi:hypothetical protein G6O69_33505 [Pseudenhygromyxa sp. WMMC2535]|uniref:hypothetical protein n=1 Tax=Pseudenhygromyxa sp. WMMC2535 TaxID=2712867 RepID=UPI00155317A1|nr:hypothetical protein [Pseudenhygromyxa sp. WMMC2535]NVB42787.1 hypothetical protein [Pseudenhygromyxa sp. WMMC2535]
MFTLLALVLAALLAGVFFGLGTPNRARAIEGGRGHAPSLPPASALPGGDPSRAIEVESPAVIEGRARRSPCPVCGSAVRCVEHRAEVLADNRYRVARVKCPRCGFARDVWFVVQARFDKFA